MFEWQMPLWARGLSAAKRKLHNQNSEAMEDDDDDFFGQLLDLYMTEF